MLDTAPTERRVRPEVDEKMSTDDTSMGGLKMGGHQGVFFNIFYTGQQLDDFIVLIQKTDGIFFDLSPDFWRSIHGIQDAYQCLEIEFDKIDQVLFSGFCAQRAQLEQHRIFGAAKGKRLLNKGGVICRCV